MRNKILPYNRNLKYLARELRKNSTLSEVLLWEQIKGKALGVEFQASTYSGLYSRLLLP